jgi:arginine-tRNA-protein transferase
MSQLNEIPIATVQYYLTTTYTCSYLPDLQARSQVATPTLMIDTPIYSALVQLGFRRSGTYTYRPHCDNCFACVPLRVLSKEFAPTRSQRRAWRQHSNLIATVLPLQNKSEHYELYQRYQHTRHKGGGMDIDDPESYQNFLLQSNVDTLLVEFRDQNVLRMVSIIDVLSDGLSSVYTFYEPEVPHARFGVYNVMWQIELSRQLNLDFVYLGYWIEHSKKMAYKIEYQPAQGFQNGSWDLLRN